MPLNKSMLFNQLEFCQTKKKQQSGKRSNPDQRNTTEKMESSIPELLRKHSIFFHGSPDSRRSSAAPSSHKGRRQLPARSPWAAPDRAPTTLLICLSVESVHHEKQKNQRKKTTSSLPRQITARARLNPRFDPLQCLN